MFNKIINLMGWDDRLASTSQACCLAHFAWLAQWKVFKYCVLFCILFIIQWWPKLLEHLEYLRGFSCFCWIGHYNTHKTNYCRNYLRRKESAGTLKMMDWSSTPSSKFGASWKINWSDLLYIQRKAFGLSCRRHGITLVLKFLGNILTLCQRDVLL